MSGDRECHLRMHPDDAASAGVRDGETVAIASRTGSIEVTLRVSDEVMPGSAGLTHGWGHSGGWRRAVAAGGAGYNRLAPNAADQIDRASGNAWFNGLPVQIRPRRELEAGEMDRVCVIGAGFTGLGMAKALRDRGIAYHHLEKNADVGGNWLNGVYSSVHLLSSRHGTGYAEFPMPSHLPDFPSGAEVLAYLRSYADEYGLRERIEFGCEVERVEPIDADGMGGWRVVTGTDTREYAAVVVANGHHWHRCWPKLPGGETFPGCMLHSKDYTGPEQLEGRVLVIGAATRAATSLSRARGADIRRPWPSAAATGSCRGRSWSSRPLTSSSAWTVRWRCSGSPSGRCRSSRSAP